MKIFFFPFISPRVGVCEGWTRGMYKHSITPAALLGWEGAEGGKRCYQESVTAESFRREAVPPQPHKWRIWYWGSCCWALTTSPTPLGSQLVHALLFNCLLLRVAEKQKKVQGLVSLNSSAWSWGNSLWSRFRFVALNIRAVSILLLVCVIRRKKMDKTCLDWEGNDPLHTCKVFGWIKWNKLDAWSATSPLKNNDTRKANTNTASGLGNKDVGVRTKWKSPLLSVNWISHPKYSHLWQC